MLDQFELALQRGLQGRLSPMVERQWRAINQLTPPSHKMDGSDSRDNWSIQPFDVDDCEDHPCPRSLLERMSLPKFYIDTPDPTPSSSTSSFSCNICTSFQRTFIDHNTPDCRHYICFVCKTTQPGHFPEDCPDRPTTIVPTDLIDWRLFNPTKGIVLWLVPFVPVIIRLSFSFSLFSFLFDYRYTHNTRGLLLILTHTRAQTVYMRTDHQYTV